VNYNATAYNIPGLKPALDGKMRLLWRPFVNPDWTEVDTEWLQWQIPNWLDLGHRFILPDPEGSVHQVWKRSDAAEAAQSIHMYLEIAEVIWTAYVDWCRRENLPLDYAMIGLYGFPRWGRRPAQGMVSEEDYRQQLEIERHIYQYVNVLTPSQYMFSRRDGEPDFERFDTACALVREEITAHWSGPWYPYIRRGVNRRPDLTAVQFAEYVRIVESYSPTGLIYWESIQRWNRSTEVTDWQIGEHLS
jgi:hypothetical protein